MIDLIDRNNIAYLVKTFYTKVQEDFFLKKVFNIAIPDHLWEHHFEKLTDFWEVNLIQNGKYEGHPINIHLWADNISGRIIEEFYFERWLNL